MPPGASVPGLARAPPGTGAPPTPPRCARGPRPRARNVTSAIAGAAGTRRSPTPAGGACSSLDIGCGVGVGGLACKERTPRSVAAARAAGVRTTARSRPRVARARRPACRHTAVSPLTRSVRVFPGSTYRRHPHRQGSDSDVGPPSADRVSSLCGSSRAGVTARVRRTGLDAVGNALLTHGQWQPTGKLVKPEKVIPLT